MNFFFVYYIEYHKSIFNFKAYYQVNYFSKKINSEGGPRVQGKVKYYTLLLISITF